MYVVYIFNSTSSLSLFFSLSLSNLNFVLWFKGLDFPVFPRVLCTSFTNYMYECRIKGRVADQVLSVSRL